MTTDPTTTPGDGMPNEIVPLRKLIADTAERLDGTTPDPQDVFCAPVVAKLDDLAAERIAVAVLGYFGKPVTV